MKPRSPQQHNQTYTVEGEDGDEHQVSARDRKELGQKIASGEWDD